MSILSKLRSKHVWNNAELKRKSALYDRLSIGAMLLIVLSAWLTPQYAAEYSKAIMLGCVGLALLMMVLSWYTEKQDSKYSPPPVDDTENNQQ